MSLEVPRPAGADLLASVLLGVDDARRRLPEPGPGGVRGALERAVLPALRRPPCLVSFSGGRDSSAVLAVAVDAARRHGLPEPIPTTLRFPDAAESDEREWQALVLDHLGMERHDVIERGDDLDLLGPTAQAVLRRHGVRWPPNAHLHLELFERCRGGSVLTGVGGDETLGTSGGRFTLLLRGKVRPRTADARLVAHHALPRGLRARGVRRRERIAVGMPWLTPAGAALLERRSAAEDVAWPDRWDGTIRHWYRSRAYTAVLGMLPLLAEPYDVLAVNPLVVPEVLAAMAAEAGPVGWRGRHAAMHRLFGDLLPEALIARPDKAEFTQALTGRHTRAFAAGWDGSGVDRELVDVEALRAQWLSERPDFRTALLLQTAYVASGELLQ